MSEEMVLAVLNDVLEELQEANKSLKEMSGTVKGLETRVQAFEKKEIKIEPPDLGPVKEQVVAECAELRKETMAGLLKVATAVETQPKAIVRRISFFPENDREGSYKTFIRWLTGGIIVAMMVLTAYVLINEWVLRMYPREMPAAVSGMVMTPEASPPPVSVPVRKAGGGGFRKGLKKSRKKIDTLEQNDIRHFSDSLEHN